MKYFDMHCDTVGLCAKSGGDLYHIDGSMVDFEKMAKGDALAQCFAVFLPPPTMWENTGIKKIEDEDYIAICRKIILDSVSAHSDIIAMAYNGQDIENNAKNGKMSAVLTMEDGRAVQGKLENLKRFYDDGFRALSLTWNFVNCFGSPNSTNPQIMSAGLSDFGKEAVEYMQQLGMLVDVSHLSEGGFLDVAEICKKPFIATHSNARALSPHQRNLSDNQIKALANVGGVTGLNFCPQFLNEDITCDVETKELIVKHAKHIVNVGGIDVCGLGSDFDGITGKLEIGTSRDMPILAHEFSKAGFTDDEIEKIFYKNVLRVFKEAL